VHDVPVDGQEVYAYASATRGGPVDADPQWLRATFAGFPDPVPRVLAAALARPAALHHSPIEEVRVVSWAEGRTVLIGDAAHATAPVWAQGAALAVEDALVLAEILATRDDWSRAGTDWEERRRPRVARAGHDRPALACPVLPGWLRDVVLPLVAPRSYRETYGPLSTPVVLPRATG
jgi:2-polyprenyl-6-methoxyphenol hydroxylase-like FAD-dependent oxidoreductase